MKKIHAVAKQRTTLKPPKQVIHVRVNRTHIFLSFLISKEDYVQNGIQPYGEVLKVGVFKLTCLSLYANTCLIFSCILGMTRMRIQYNIKWQH